MNNKNWRTRQLCLLFVIYCRRCKNTIFGSFPTYIINKSEQHATQCATAPAQQLSTMKSQRRSNAPIASLLAVVNIKWLEIKKLLP